MDFSGGSRATRGRRSRPDRLAPGRRRRRSQEPPAPRAPRRRAGFRDRIEGLRSRRAFTVAGFAALGAGIILGGLLVMAFKDLPDPTDIQVASNSIRFLDRSGNVIEERSTENHLSVPIHLSQMGKLIPEATIAAEDRQFYQHGAIDIPRLAKAMLVDLTHGEALQGGSTITQQLVKIHFFSQSGIADRSLLRKIRELILAYQIENDYSKDQILEMYLNQIFYGHNSWGIEAAAQTYFGVHAGQVDLAQAAFLASMPNAPTLLDPERQDPSHPLWLDRVQYVLQGMIATQAITQGQADAAMNEAAHLHFVYSTRVTQSPAPHFIDWVEQELESELGPGAIQQGGFTVYTTLDLPMQQEAARDVARGVRELGYLKINNGALLAAAPDTGEILAMVGSANYYDDSIDGQNNIVTSWRQPGSSFKPYTVISALHDHKITLASVFSDTVAAATYGNLSFHDWDGLQEGPITVRQALVQSRNIPMVQIGALDGMTNVVAMAHRMMGTTDTAQHALRPELDTAIGGSEVRMIDHVEGYATLANGGWHIPLTGVLKVIDSQGHVVENYDPNAIAHQQVVSPQEAYLVTDVLRHYNQQWHLGFRLPFAAKSGTTNDFADAWLMAYSPQLVVGTWTGNTPHGGGREPTDGVFGSMTGIYVTAPFLNSTAVARLNITDFTKPDGLVSATVCGQSAPELYLPGTQPTTCGGPQPSVIPSGSPAPSPSPSPSPSEETSPLPPSPSVTVYLTPSAAPSSNTSPSPNASPSPRSSSPQPSSSP